MTAADIPAEATAVARGRVEGDPAQATWTARDSLPAGSPPAEGR